MKKMQLLALLLGLLGAAFGQNAENPAITTETGSWKLLDTEEYSIEYPAHWELNDSKMMGTSFLLLSPLRSPDDLFRENVNLMAEDLRGQELGLDEYVGLALQQMQRLITDGQLLESERLQAHGKDYHRILYTGKQGIFELKFLQYCWIRAGQAQVLTLSCEAKEYDNYREEGEKVMNSFAFKEGGKGKSLVTH